MEVFFLNYCPYFNAILPTVSKILEKVLYDYNCTGILVFSTKGLAVQYGFRKKTLNKPYGNLFMNYFVRKFTQYTVVSANFQNKVTVIMDFIVLCVTSSK